MDAEGLAQACLALIGNANGPIPGRAFHLAHGKELPCNGGAQGAGYVRPAFTPVEALAREVAASTAGPGDVDTEIA